MAEISIILPVYGVERYIQRTLISLFTQTRTSGVEFILVNDATPDNSMVIAREVIANFPNLDIKIIDKPQNEGVAAARQDGLELASGEYILHFDPDDWCTQDMVERLMRLAKERDADIVVCDFWVNTTTHESYVRQLPQRDGHECVDALLQGRLHGSLWSKLVKKSLYQKSGAKFIKGINFMEDQLIMVKLFSCAERVVFIEKAFVHYMQNEGSIVATCSDSKLMNALDVVKHIDKYFEERGLVERFKVAMESKRATTKLFVLRFCHKDQQVKYLEQIPKLGKYGSLPQSGRLALKMAEDGRLKLFNQILTIDKFIKTLKHRIERY